MKTLRFLAVAAMAATAIVHAQIPAASMSEGEVLKVMPKAVLLKHGPIQNIGMDAMTMQFKVTDAKLLKAIRKGDKVRFVAGHVNGQFVVTRIERVK